MNRISKGTSGNEGKGRMFRKLESGGRVGARTLDNDRAFTLIELLAVIAIIALLAGIVLGTAGIATTKSHESRMKGEHARLLTAIEDYKATLGNFPPDNPDYSLDPYIRAGRNSLFYELSGCTFDSAGTGSFTTQNKADSVTVADLRSALGAKGVENSARNKKDIPWRGVSFKPGQFDDIDGWEDVDILITPLPGPHDAKFPKRGKTKNLNPWFYDASSTNRHNRETFDLWTEYKTRDGVKTIGNW